MLKELSDSLNKVEDNFYESPNYKVELGQVEILKAKILLNIAQSLQQINEELAAIAVNTGAIGSK